MNAHEVYVRSIFEALFLTAVVHAEYDVADEMWSILVSRPARTVGGIKYPAVGYHYSMTIGSDDDEYCFTEADDLLPQVRFPIITDEIFAIWENDDAPTVRAPIKAIR